MKAVRVVDTDCELCKGRGVIVRHKLMGSWPGRQWVVDDCSCVYYAEFSFAEHHEAGKKMFQRLEFGRKQEIPE